MECASLKYNDIILRAPHQAGKLTQPWDTTCPRENLDVLPCASFVLLGMISHFTSNLFLVLFPIQNGQALERFSNRIQKNIQNLYRKFDNRVTIHNNS